MSIEQYPPDVHLKIDAILTSVGMELMHAISKHPKFPTCHHGESVIREEYEELWDEIKANRGNLGPAKREALQLACVAVRYVLDLCQYDAPTPDAIASTSCRHCMAIMTLGEACDECGDCLRTQQADASRIDDVGRL